MQNVSLAAVVAVLIAWAVALALVLAGAQVLALWLFRFDLVTPGMGVIVPLLAAMSAGQFWRRRVAARPAGVLAWAVSAIATLVLVAAQAGLMWLALRAGLFGAGLAGIGLSDVDWPGLLLALAAVALVVVLLIRLGLWTGFRAAERQAAR
jgi:hypothetical protein